VNASLNVVSQSDDDPPFKIDPHAITHAFAALTIADRAHSDALGNQIAQLSHHCQPAVWDVQFNARFTLYAAEPGKDGYPSPSSWRT
jgi:hypothetical protein